MLAVYTAGYLRTQAAAERFAADGTPRTARPAPPVAGVPAAVTPAAQPLAEPPAAAAQPKRRKVQRPKPPEPPTVEAKPEAPPPVPLPPPAPALKDGTYYGWGTSRHGDIQASVVIEKGRITAASIAQCLTRYSCSWIAALPPQVVSRQSAEVDFITGATQSTNAFYYAILEALAKAK